MNIQVISLERTPQRLAEFRSKNSHIDSYGIFPAIDGQAVDLHQLEAGGYVDRALSYSLGAIGSAMSHIRLWERASIEDKVLTIAEDDSVLHRDFSGMSRKLLAGLPPDWDLVMWGWNFDAEVTVDPGFDLGPVRALFDQDAMRAGMDRYLKSELRPAVHKLIAAFGIHCYSISPGGARKFLRNVLPLRNTPVVTPYREFPNQALSMAMSSFHRSSNCYVAMPPIALVSNYKSVSTVFPSPHLAQDAYKAKNFPEAERLCREILRIDPRTFEVLHLLGVTCASMGRRDEGVECLTKALDYRPSDTAARMHLAAVLVDMGRLDDALAHFEIATSLSPTNAETHASMARLLCLLKRFPEAVQACDKALAFNPGDDGVRELRSAALSRVRETDARSSLKN